jgi:16S rRNA (guanine527-N7)-methyltransferase
VSGLDGVSGLERVPDPPEPAASRVFGERLPVAVRYAQLLATDGVVRGLIGPRESPRLWDRHLLNCAVVADLVPIHASVLDLGSGAGLPGIVLALARPDLVVTLVEPLARRTAFLHEMVAELRLGERVSVSHCRAEEYAGPSTDVVTARAVAPLDRLARLALPLCMPGGRLLAIKGAAAAEEAASHAEAVRRVGGGTPVVRRCGPELLDPPTTIIEVVRCLEVPDRRSRHRGR